MKIFVTIGGSGTRMKEISPFDKQFIYYRDKRIIEHIFQIFPDANLLGDNKTNSRRETLQEIAHEQDCLIVDCDIIPVGLPELQFDGDTLFYFNSDKLKYGSILIEDGKLLAVDEKNSISKNKCSGIYFVKSMSRLLEQMKDDNSLASGMIGAKVIQENTFIKLGDVEDYYEAL